MNHPLPARGALAFALLLALPAFAQQPAARPDDGAGAYKTGHYRNLFAERLGVTPQQTHDRVERTFQQLFHGDGQEQRVYFETGANANGTLAYITDWANNDARTEGMSYGMMIAVQLGKKREFDALWNWSKTTMLTTDRPIPRLDTSPGRWAPTGRRARSGPRPTARNSM